MSGKITILHCSDSHGTLPILPKEGDVVVHSGDMMPNASRGIRHIEYQFQTQWMQRAVETYKRWLDGRPIIYSAGNHDYILNPMEILQDAGINATDITNKRCTFRGLRLFGFPYINYIDNEWNYELRGQEMANEVRRLKDELIRGVDILVAHSPIYGILDSNFVTRDPYGNIKSSEYGEHIGNRPMADLFSYGLDPEYWPRYYLHGHCHEHWGNAKLDEMIISNAATRVHVIEIPTSE